MWRLIAVGLLVAGLAGGVARVLHAQETSGGTAQRLFDAITALTRRIERLESVTLSVPAGTVDATGFVQAAIDSGVARINFPAGTYAMCNVQPRALHQHWVGAGPGQSIIQGTSGCSNPIATSFGGVFGGPTQDLEIEGFTFQQTAGNDLNIQCRDVPAYVHIHDNAFDTCTQTGGTAQGINLAGCRNFVIEDNDFYSTCPGKGKGILAVGIRGGTIRRNTSNWVSEFLEIGTTANQPTEFTNVSQNIYHGTFWGIPTKYTNSGATVTYPGGVLTDTAAAFDGLCTDAGHPPGACAGAGNFVRTLTSKVASTANFNTAGGMISDAGGNFIVNGVRRGDIVKTTPLCLGNGTGLNNQRGICAGGAGTNAWGDSCVCTANADCRSNICEPRWATVDTVTSATLLQVDEWVRETACPLGGAICPEATRRPTGAPLTLGAIAYTIYGWKACQITSYTATTATCNTDGWFDWAGSVADPGAGELYEIMYARPLYFLLVGNTASITATQGIRAENNTVSGGFADNFELFGSENIVLGNYARDCGDTCFVVEGSKNTVTGNLAEHCGARGILVLGNDSTISTNVAWDSPWLRVSNTTTAGDFAVLGNRNTFIGNKALGAMPTNLNRYGFVSFGNATGNTDENQFVNNTCAGTYTVGCWRLDATGGTTTNNHLVGYHGETISNNGGTYSIEGGKATFAQVVTAGLAPLNGSYVGCPDCTPASPCVAGGGGGSILKRMGAAWNCP